MKESMGSKIGFYISVILILLFLSFIMIISIEKIERNQNAWDKQMINKYEIIPDVRISDED